MTKMDSWLRQKLPLLFDKENNVETLTIPIFPLNTVLFPGGILPLRIFEPRYMDMTKACMRDKLPFGICLIKEGEETGTPAIPEAVGCLAEITNWDMHQQGILNLTTIGLQRISIQSQKTSKEGLITAKAFKVSIEPAQKVPESLMQCVNVLQNIITKVGEDKFQSPLQYDDAAWVGYRLAEVLPLKLSAKQSMLEMNDSITRLQILQSFMKQQGLLG
ncbi:LON peptidase substrate-binding domain-containing protein [Sulfurirhabdus autotrophica]|uniref:Lon N-terminal domain-containing protein n=1 Tax=Sulfurirhabdus autotrophica TaxID=1706046 RepID=A0A4R3XR31_9PROT|nr:LON peptidase substrate-binding domain-containing protein [Sulfurirhabdus autotrophica]TCV78298.1 hypothetical protein EDC63_1391 [Sulfurirhabdus autotrophica]